MLVTNVLPKSRFSIILHLEMLHFVTSVELLLINTVSYTIILLCHRKDDDAC